MASFKILDDFENYTDEEGSEIFMTWLDGFDDPATNGGLSSHNVPPFAEQGITRNNSFQSMPFRYSNGPARNSEVTLPLQGEDRDWSADALLRFWYHGQETNAGSPSDQLFVHITDAAGKTATAPAALFDELLTSGWTQVDIDLRVLDVDISQVA